MNTGYIGVHCVFVVFTSAKKSMSYFSYDQTLYRNLKEYIVNMWEARKSSLYGDALNNPFLNFHLGFLGILLELTG